MHKHDKKNNFTVQYIHVSYFNEYMNMINLEPFYLKKPTQ